MSSSSENVRCEVPSNADEKKEVGLLAQSLRPKVVYNDDIKFKQTMTALGYVIYIIPGIAAKYYYDGERERAINESERILRTPASAH